MHARFIFCWVGGLIDFTNVIKVDVDVTEMPLSNI